MDLLEAVNQEKQESVRTEIPELPIQQEVPELNWDVLALLWVGGFELVELLKLLSVISV